MGRPSKYQEDFPARLVKHMEAGYSFETFAAVIHVNIDTMHDWCRKWDDEAQSKPNPRFKSDFSDAKKEGLHRGQRLWEKIGLYAALGLPMKYKDEKGIEHDVVQYNPTIWIFNMKNRFGWRDKRDITTDDKPMDATSHNALREIAEAMKNANRDSQPNDPARSDEEPAGDAEPGEVPN